MGGGHRMPKISQAIKPGVPSGEEPVSDKMEDNDTWRCPLNFTHVLAMCIPTLTQAKEDDRPNQKDNKIK